MAALGLRVTAHLHAADRRGGACVRNWRGRRNVTDRVVERVGGGPADACVNLANLLLSRGRCDAGKSRCVRRSAPDEAD